MRKWQMRRVLVMILADTSMLLTIDRPISFS